MRKWCCTKNTACSKGKGYDLWDEVVGLADHAGAATSGGNLTAWGSNAKKERLYRAYKTIKLVLNDTENLGSSFEASIMLNYKTIPNIQNAHHFTDMISFVVLNCTIMGAFQLLYWGAKWHLIWGFDIDSKFGLKKQKVNFKGVTVIPITCGKNTGEHDLMNQINKS